MFFFNLQDIAFLAPSGPLKVDYQILKPGFHISRKDRKHRLENDRKYLFLTINICNQYAEGFKILLNASSQACSATLATITVGSNYF